MKLNEWRSDPSRVKAAQKLLQDQIFAEMLATLTEDNPVYYPLPLPASGHPPSVTPEDMILHLGRIEGACAVILAIKSMGTPLRTRKEVPITYGAKEGGEHHGQKEKR